MNHESIEEWWDEVSSYYQEEIGSDDLKTVRYGPFGSTERKLRLLGDVRGMKILELGCGGGQTSIALAKRGAKCVGIDISEKQLGHARKLAKKNNVAVEFIKKSFSDLEHPSDSFRNGSFDIVVSVFALQYARDLDRVLRGASRVLKTRGLLVFSIDHPFYLLIDPETMEIEDSYYRTGKLEEEEKWPEGSRHTFVMYRRRVSDVVNALVRNGFAVERIEEPFDPDDKVWGSGYRRKLVRRIGPTIIFKCRKTPTKLLMRKGY